MVKILLADDDPAIVEMLEYNLKKEGFVVYTTSDGEEALEIAKRELPNLMILDIMMPKLDGVEVCERVRSMRELDQSLIVFLTARSEDFTQIACYENGGDDYIVKPIKPKVLISRLKAILKRQLPTDTADKKHVLTFGNISIDVERYEVKKDQQGISLAKKEFELLLLLGSKPGKLFTRDEIFNKVWGTDTAIGDRTIDVHIRKLREKIGDTYIKTIKGLGYKIEVL